MDSANAADSDLIAVTTGLHYRRGSQRRIPVHAWLKFAQALKSVKGSPHPEFPLADIKTIKSGFLVAMSRILEIKPVYVSYAMDADFRIPKDWPTPQIKSAMRGVTTLEACHYFCEWRETPARGVKLYEFNEKYRPKRAQRTPDAPTLVAYTCGMSIEWMARILDTTEQKVLDSMLTTANRLWEEHVGFVIWANNLDPNFIPFFDFGSNVPLEKRVRELATLTHERKKFYMSAKPKWRKENPRVWKRIQDGRFPKLKASRGLGLRLTTRREPDWFYLPPK